MRMILMLAAGAVVVAASAGLWEAGRREPAHGADAPQVAVTTAPVGRGDIVSRLPFSGTLGYEGTVSILNQLPAGVVTAAPPAGAVIGRGSRLFAVRGTAAVLLYGRVPAYRPFTSGMTDGPDVLELERNLDALGHAPGTVDRHFSATTAAAVRRWQKARGLPSAARTGELALGEVVFLRGPVRISRVTTGAGASAGPGTRMLAGTSTSKTVRVSVPAEQRPHLHVGDPVQVMATDSGSALRGRVRTVGKVATTDQPAQQDGPPPPPTVAVTVTLVDPPRTLTELDQVPVQVAIETERRRNVLTVPVTALLARPGGGYQVAVRNGSARRLVPVTPGLFDDTTGTVEVTGVDEGARVEVPVS
ncbi:peptidoglycan-binding protein [Actinomadura sp. NPDC000600]|uniref:peptidoglycan-binding protein n=1 Tax=Actinomadura sp. NPDC000600 TaxID=3154262 RepID=UPI003398A2EB